MSVVLGTGEFRYRVLERWGELPDGWTFRDVAAVGIDRRDNVYVFNRGPHPMVVFDRDGRFLKSWGEGLFRRPHGVLMGPDETIYLTDDGDHTVRKCTLDGKVLLEIGIPGEPAPYMSGLPFHRCTHTALSPSNDIYISDGYGNSCVHKYSPDGKRLLTWGQPGCEPGEFNLPHNICTDEEGWVYVADRENHRVQVFDGDGNYETQWNNLHRPSALFMPRGKCPLCYIGEGAPYLTPRVPNLGPRIRIVDNEGKKLAVLSRTPLAGREPGQFISPHGLAVDSRGDIYVADVAYNSWYHLFPEPTPDDLRPLQKLVRIADPPAE